MTDNTGVGVHVEEISSSEEDVEELEELVEEVVVDDVVWGSNVTGLVTNRGVVETTVVRCWDGVCDDLCKLDSLNNTL